MNIFNLADLIYEEINLNRYFKSCTHALETNVIEITDKEGKKFLIIVQESK